MIFDNEIGLDCFFDLNGTRSQVAAEIERILVLEPGIFIGEGV